MLLKYVSQVYGATSNPLNTLLEAVSQPIANQLWRDTFWYGKNDQARCSTNKKGNALADPPPKAFDQRETAQPGRKLGDAKYELSEVDIQAKVAHVQTHAVVDQAGYKPAQKAQERKI